VFAGERSAIADDEVGGFFDELAVFGDAFGRLQIEVEARVDAGMAEVSVERALVAERRHHFAKIAKISAETSRFDGGIFPSFPVERFTGNVRSCAETRLADFPDALGLRARVKLHLRGSRVATECVDEVQSLGLGFG